MTQESLGKMRLAMLLSATALVAVPAMAQEAQVTPPPVTSTAAPTTSTVTPPPIVSTVTPSSSAAASDGASSTPVNPDAAAAAAAEDAQRASTRRPAVRTAPVRATATRTAPVAAAAPAAATPAATPAPAATEPAAQPAAQTEAARATQAPAPATQQTQTTESGPPLWPLALIAALIVAAGAAFYFLRRRREQDVYEEPIYAEPVYEQPVAAEPVIERSAPSRVVPATAAAGAAGVMIDDTRRDTPVATPVAEVTPEPVMVTDATPVAAEDATVAEAEGEDVAALTATQLNGNRPWLEFAMRPVRAGTNVDEAIVEIELTVANAGNMPADDVRISTFMLPAGSETEMERLLTERHDEAVAPLTIGAGEGTRVDATLVTSKADLVNGADHAAFQPVIVADARYRLPDGSEGRTSASFVIGGSPESGETLEPISLDRPLLREDVEARLYREPARV